MRNLKALTTKPWVVKSAQAAKDIAACSGKGSSATLSIGPRALTGKFLAGVLIHELGHAQGLPDICAICHAPLISQKHLSVASWGVDKAEGTYTIDSCNKNDAHGALAGADPPGGHFISAGRCQKLAKDHKNVSVFNTDSYRWYCCNLFTDEVMAEARPHTDAVRLARLGQVLRSR